MQGSLRSTASRYIQRTAVSDRFSRVAEAPLKLYELRALVQGLAA